MNNNRKTATIVGILFILGTVSGILSAVLTGSTFSDPQYLTAVSENESSVLLGAFFILLMGVSLAMVPVMMFPIFKKHNEALALGAVIFRGPLEAVLYLAQVLSFLFLISLSREYVSAGAASSADIQIFGNVLLNAGGQINQVLEIIFSIGALMFYTLFYQTRLIPRWLSGWGFLGGVLYLAAGLLDLFGMGLSFLLIPLALQEMVLAVWLIAVGFRQTDTGNQSAK